MSQYHKFAEYYDLLTADVDYKSRAGYFNRIIRQHLPDAKLLLDLGCGTGSLSVELAACGYDVIGIDASEEMLSKAMQKSPPEILYLCQDMREIDLYGTIDAAVCALDSINHLEDEEDVLDTFQGVSLFSNPGALFVFDVNTPYKHREVLADNSFVYETDAVFCTWQNTYHQEDDVVEIDLDFFEPDGQCYRRYSEYFCERAYQPEQLEMLLEKAGFELLHIHHEDSLDEPKPDSERLIFVARKK
ncbi:class I SAM-dependent DNA methyltransferase [Candidatus Soleaferrea massiliensis]|uniref:class I SAM-dependent DNA methyltransferase n=1 Tax=Candidatus Soleaferrea massiliensis TaxID=1470354 RepID=UPI000591339E|nr:class I SAM-dependent methyltransferase [Candidatus Soleaferrea massiliensis]